MTACAQRPHGPGNERGMSSGIVSDNGRACDADVGRCLETEGLRLSSLLAEVNVTLSRWVLLARSSRYARPA